MYLDVLNIKFNINICAQMYMYIVLNELQNLGKYWCVIVFMTVMDTKIGSTQG